MDHEGEDIYVYYMHILLTIKVDELSYCLCVILCNNVMRKSLGYGLNH